MSKQTQITRRKILDLIKNASDGKNYPDPILQELLAEIVLKVSKPPHSHKLEKILKSLYGKRVSNKSSQDDFDCFEALRLQKVENMTKYGSVEKAISRHYKKSLKELKRDRAFAQFQSHKKRIVRKLDNRSYSFTKEQYRQLGHDYSELFEISQVMEMISVFKDRYDAFYNEGSKILKEDHDFKSIELPETNDEFILKEILKSQ
tara:strand:+ start:1266 stop:1877 length:612 start_codon:yes stop_codon:yes gene_type:complete